MANEPFMLVSLKGDKAKKLAQVMSNPTCTKILEYLAGKDATETQIAGELAIPLSTVHYNLQQMVAAKLVVVDEFHYSEKGREVNHYKLAKKYIIIAPDDDDPTFLERLKKFVPITLVTLGAAVIIKTLQVFTGTMAAGTSKAEMLSLPVNDIAQPMAKAAVAPFAADQAIGAGAPEGARLMAAPQGLMNETLNQTVNQTAAAANEAFNAGNPAATSFASNTVPPSVPWWQSHAIDYFIAGAIFVLVVLVIAEAISYWREKRTKK